MSEETASDKNVEIWKVKKLIKSLQLARGNGTSMISLIIPPGDQVLRHNYRQNQILRSRIDLSGGNKFEKFETVRWQNINRVGIELVWYSNGRKEVGSQMV